MAQEQTVLETMTRPFCHTGRRRRMDIERAVLAVEHGDVLLGAVLTVMLLGLVLSQSTASLQPLALQWVAWSVAIVGLAAMILLRALLAACLAPGQVTGAAVDAMALDASDEGFVPFAEQPVEELCRLAALRLARWMAHVARRARVMVRAIWGRVWRRSTLLAVIGALSGRVRFLPRRLPEPLS